MWHQRIAQRLEQRRQAGTYRQRQINAGIGHHVLHNGRRYLNFSGNDYLGLSQSPEIIAAWQAGASRYGVGSGGSGHVTGYGDAHAELEQQLAEWLGYPRALLFISGFAANHAIVTALLEKGDRIVADRLSHASLLEAALHSGATLRRFAHNQPQDLQRLLVKRESGLMLSVTEGIFSMEGDRAPLAELARLSRQAGSLLLVDDAHGIGVTGEQGRGSCWRQGVYPDLLVVTFGKAFGISGAAVLCSEPLAEYLLQFARHLIYSTAMPPAQAWALQSALRQIQQGDELRQTLTRRIAQFRQGMAALPYALADSDTAIQPLLVGDSQRAQTLALALRDHGLWVSAIRPPTVPPGGARLRITLTAAHQAEDVERLLEALHDVRFAIDR